MPNYARVVISGTSQGGEIWSVGLNYTGATGFFTQASLQTWANGISSYIQGLGANNLLTLLSSSGAVTLVRTEKRSNTDALLLAAEAAVSPAKVGLGTPTKTFQNALCISLRTGVPGRSHKGRVYWPAWNFTTAATLRFATATLTGALTDFKALNTAIVAAGETADPAVDLFLVVRSKVLDAETIVLTIAAGDVPDAQRRRRDDLIEAYQTLAL
jgi:hypothetical protein